MPRPFGRQRVNATPAAPGGPTPALAVGSTQETRLGTMCRHVIQAPKRSREHALSPSLPRSVHQKPTRLDTDRFCPGVCGDAFELAFDF